jgi:glycosyltransferase involved in cell wall biosynthesis
LPIANQFLTVVIVLDHASLTGGQARVAFESARGLKQAGHRPIVFAAAGPVDPGLQAEGVEIVCLNQFDMLNDPSRLNAALRGLWNFAAAEKLRDLLASLPRGPTVVHVHGWAKALSPSIAGVIARSGLPAVYTIHEYFLFCPNGGFYNYQTQKPCPLTPMSAQCLTTNCDSRSYPQKLWRVARQAIMQHVADLPSAFGDFIVISKFQRDVIGARLPRAAVIHDVSNPVEATDLGPKLHPASGDIIFVGRIALEKGPLLFAEAARQAGIVPVFVGDGPAAAALRGDYPEARILGWKRPDEVASQMRAARALVFPSLWYEGQPLTVMEAKAMGTPVVVSDGCAGREEIADGRSGLWFKNGDAGSLAAALTRLKDDRLVESLSQGAYGDFWGNPPSLARHVETVVGIYRGMLAPDRAAATAA